MKTFGIFGQGFVGNSIREGFKEFANVLTYDKYRSELSNATPKQIVEACDIIFACVPTPMDAETGEASIHIVEEVISTIDNLASELGKQPIIIIKSTVPPGTTQYFNKNKASNCDVIFNPEFLTEANAVEDFKNQDKIVLGVDGAIKIDSVIELFEETFPNIPFLQVSSTEAEMMKYVINNFLSVKVSFLNEIYNICQANHIDYNRVATLAKTDQRLGDSHWMVPGPDGDFGFGGHCFPGNYKVITSEGPITLQEAYYKFINDETIIVESYNYNLTSKDKKEVEEVTCNKFEGELYEFTLENGNIIECTPDHIFPIKRNDKIVLVQAKNITKNDNLHMDSEYIKYNQKTMTYDTQI